MKPKKGCNQCGHCCRVIVNIIPMSPAGIEWAKARGYKVLDSSDKWLAVQIPSRCPHLTEGNKCDMEANKPETCRLYPSYLRQVELARMGLRRNRLLGNCGYKDH